MENKIKITSTEILSDYFFTLKKVGYVVETENGSTKEITREVYAPANGAAALLYNRENQTVVLIKQLRLPSFLNMNEEGFLIEACAGIVDQNEDPKAAIIREIEEETGYKVDNVVKIFDLYSTPGSVTEMISYFVAEYSAEQKTGIGGGLVDENEEIEVLEMNFEAAYIKIGSGEIKDAKTVTLLQYAKLNLFEQEKVFEVL